MLRGIHAYPAALVNRNPKLFPVYHRDEFSLSVTLSDTFCSLAPVEPICPVIRDLEDPVPALTVFTT